jgi:EmrB/QacA subfamily drug resistance transporter
VTHGPTHAADPDHPGFNLHPRQKLEILAAILLALFLFALDQTVVGTALPIISTALDGASLYTWAFTIYLLTSTISGPIYGKLSDLYGRRPIFIWAVGLFLAASVFAGLSQEMWQFILARGLQGLGGGAVFPIAFAIIADLYPPEERAKYGALFGAVFGLSSVLGPLLGGYVTDTFGWPWIFFLNVPLGLVSLFVCWRLLPPIKHPEAGRNIDYIGAGLFTAALIPILLGLSNKRTLPWTDPWVGGLILVGLAVAAVFIWWESRAVDPIIRLQLFRNRTVSISIACMFLAAFGFFGAIVFLPQWFQVVRGMGATESGLNLLPLVFALILGATVSGQIAARTSRYKEIILGSMLILALGLFLLTNLRADTELPILWLWMVVAGIGVGPSFALFAALVQNNVEPRQVGSATASLTFFQQIGGTIGLTIAGTALADALTRELPVALAANGLPQPMIDAFQQQASSGGAVDFTQTGDLGQTILEQAGPARPFIEPFITQIVQALHEAIAIAIASTFWISIAAAVLAAVLVLFLRAAPSPLPAPAEGEGEPAAA